MHWREKEKECQSQRERYWIVQEFASATKVSVRACCKSFFVSSSSSVIVVVNVGLVHHQGRPQGDRPMGVKVRTQDESGRKEGRESGSGGVGEERERKGENNKEEAGASHVMHMNDIGFCKGAKAEKMALLEASKNRSNSSKAATSAASKSRSSSSTSGIRERMRQLEDHASKTRFVKDSKKLSRSDPNYGRPQEGTKTAERGRRANSHVHKEILELCEIIYMNGFEQVMCNYYNNV